MGEPSVAGSVRGPPAAQSRRGEEVFADEAEAIDTEIQLANRPMQTTTTSNGIRMCSLPLVTLWMGLCVSSFPDAMRLSLKIASSVFFMSVVIYRS